MESRQLMERPAKPDSSMPGLRERVPRTTETASRRVDPEPIPAYAAPAAAAAAAAEPAPAARKPGRPRKVIS